MQGVQDSANQQTKATLPGAGSRGTSAGVRSCRTASGPLRLRTEKARFDPPSHDSWVTFLLRYLQGTAPPPQRPGNRPILRAIKPSRPLVAPLCALGPVVRPLFLPEFMPPYPPLPSQMGPRSHSLRSRTLCKLPGRPLQNSFVGNTTGCLAIHSFCRMPL